MNIGINRLGENVFWDVKGKQNPNNSLFFNFLKQQP